MLWAVKVNCMLALCFREFIAPVRTPRGVSIGGKRVSSASVQGSSHIFSLDMQSKVILKRKN